MKKHRTVRCGYRYFKCKKCGAMWKEACRDAQTLSNSRCGNPNCETHLTGGCSPVGFKIMDWPTDANGNLISTENTVSAWNGNWE